MTDFIFYKKTFQDKGSLVALDQADKVLGHEISKFPTADWYKSLYVFGEDFKSHFETQKSTSGFKGQAKCNYLFFDIDNGDNLEQAKNDTSEILNRLYEISGIQSKKEFLNTIQLFFSGAKGFHIYFHVQQEIPASDLRHFCSVIGKGVDSFDTQVYDIVRSIRIENTKHNKSGLYKIQLNPTKFKQMSLDEIKKQAESHTNAYTGQVTQKADISQFIESHPVQQRNRSVVVEDSVEIEGIKGLDQVAFDMMPKNKPRCLEALLQGVMVPGRGERNMILLILGNYLRNQGMSEEHVHNALKATIRMNARLYPNAEPVDKKEIWDTIIKRVFNQSVIKHHRANGYGFDPKGEEGKVIKSYCDAAGKCTDKKCSIHDVTHKKNVVQIDDVFNKFSSFTKNIQKNVVKTGIKFLDVNMKLMKGTVALLVGAAGSGKTTLCLNILENANKAGVYSIFFSMDMTSDSLYLKLAQKMTGLDQESLTQLMSDPTRTDEVEQIRKRIHATYNKTYFDFSSTLTMDEMRQRVYDIESENSIKIGFVVVDHSSRITGPHSDSYANAKYNALKSKEVADDTDAAWLYLSQISRNAGDGSSPLRTKRAAKDSGDWEEAAQNVLTMWRPFMGMDGKMNPDSGEYYKDNVLRIFMAKNRMGPELEAPFIWNPLKGEIKEMSQEQRQEYDLTGEPAEIAVRKHKVNKF